MTPSRPLTLRSPPESLLRAGRDVFLAVDLDFAARVLREQHGVSRLHVERAERPVLEDLAFSDGNDLGFDGLFFRGVGDEEPTLRLLFFLESLDDHTVVERAYFHDPASFSVREWPKLAPRKSKPHVVGVAAFEGKRRRRGKVGTKWALSNECVSAAAASRCGRLRPPLRVFRSRLLRRPDSPAARVRETAGPRQCVSGPARPWAEANSLHLERGGSENCRRGPGPFGSGASGSGLLPFRSPRTLPPGVCHQQERGRMMRVNDARISDPPMTAIARGFWVCALDAVRQGGGHEAKHGDERRHQHRRKRFSAASRAASRMLRSST